MSAGHEVLGFTTPRLETMGPRSIHCMLNLTPDIVVGIRAALVDKDKSPRWDPPTIADVTDEHVDEFFVPLGERELQLEAQE